MSATPIKITITKETDDPAKVLRASIGGRHPEPGYYLVYRGKLEHVIGMLEAVLDAAKAQQSKGN